MFSKDGFERDKTLEPAARVAGSVESIQASSNQIRKEAILGWSFAAIREIECVDFVVRELLQGRGGWILTVNVDHLRRLERVDEFTALCRSADLLVADGMPLVWASRIQGTPLPERVAGSRLITSLTAAAAANRRSIFLLGGDPGTADEAAKVLCARDPTLSVAGTYCPTITSEAGKDDAEVGRIADMLQAARPDIVFVALGSPKQEILISQLRELLPGTWWLGVGISFSYICGRIQQPPAWVGKAGLEWIFRLVQEPRRLVRRYLRDDLPFCISLLLKATTHRVRRMVAAAERE